MKSISVGLFSVGLILIISIVSQKLPMIMSQYYQVIEDRINAQFKSDKDFCNLMSDSMRSTCMSKVNDQHKVEKARLDARHKLS